MRTVSRSPSIESGIAKEGNIKSRDATDGFDISELRADARFISRGNILQQ